jgi:hypothetical protein
MQHQGYDMKLKGLPGMKAMEVAQHVQLCKEPNAHSTFQLLCLVVRRDVITTRWGASVIESKPAKVYGPVITAPRGLNVGVEQWNIW